MRPRRDRCASHSARAYHSFPSGRTRDDRATDRRECVAGPAPSAAATSARARHMIPVPAGPTCRPSRPRSIFQPYSVQRISGSVSPAAALSSAAREPDARRVELPARAPRTPPATARGRHREGPGSAAIAASPPPTAHAPRLLERADLGRHRLGALGGSGHRDRRAAAPAIDRAATGRTTTCRTNRARDSRSSGRSGLRERGLDQVQHAGSRSSVSTRSTLLARWKTAWTRSVVGSMPWLSSQNTTLLSPLIGPTSISCCGRPGRPARPSRRGRRASRRPCL